MNEDFKNLLSQKDFRRLLVLIVIISVTISSLAGFAFGFLQVSTSGFGNFFSQLKGSNQKAQTYQPQVESEAAVINAVKKVSPAVVSIIATKDLPILEQEFTNPFENDPFFKEFFKDFPIPQFGIPQLRQKGTQKQEVGGGTGFIISQNGLILTNKHVVDIEGADYTVLTNDGKKYPAKVLARDQNKDLAVIKINQTNLPTLSLGDSDSLQIGQTVIAIGNALGEFRNTVSVGVVSGLSRTVTASIQAGQSEKIEDVVQTDAAINPGNSGGPLLNLKGEVIGINTAIAIGAQNIGFAIPINKAKNDVQSVETTGKLSFPYLGVRFLIINKEVKEKNNLSVDYGALIRRGDRPEDLAVIPGSPADKAGLVENDIILEVEGNKVTQNNDLAKIVAKYKVGDTITLKILHKGEEKTIQVILNERS